MIKIKNTFYLFLFVSVFISCLEKNKKKIKYKTETKDVLFFENRGIKNERARKIFVAGLEDVEIEDFESAKKKFTQADEIENKNPIILNAISQSEIRLGNVQKSIEILLSILLIDSTYLPTYVNLGQNYMQTKDYEKAKEILLKGGKFATDKDLDTKSVLLLNLSITYNNLGDFKTGLKYSNEVIKISQNTKLTEFATKIKKESEENLMRKNIN
ncbi:tetratricopeptide repeat protein [Flavobacterium cupreum]|uniref:Tetratricopeptide repeat protein n=2 Tax=Flavobacterium TaxID=237 RepID=A0A434A606_9FLAO|nr:tetratricopeptide repeat protein [Flavobacterium cupreum]RUT69838.1 tetratricopeptide repeat protein [Flavobacterium cupreum]